MVSPLNRPAVWRPVLALSSAAVVLLGAYAAGRLSTGMMSAVGLVGGWMMLALLLCYLVARFRPALGVAVFAGFGLGAVLVAITAGMAMTHL